MKKRFYFLLLAGLLALFQGVVMAQDEEECDGEEDTRAFTNSFDTGDCRFKTRYFRHEKSNPYFIMEPGWQIVLEGEDDDEFIRLEITVLNEVERVGGIWTRVIEEREFIDGELFEVARNFFAICADTNDIYYFGEDVDFYEDGEIIDHHGAWRVGDDGGRPGLIMPGRILLGSRYFQEIAVGIAEDRAEIVDITEIEIGGEVFENVVVFKETSPLNEDPCEFEIKYYAPGIGIIGENDALELVEAGFIFTVPPAYPWKQ